ncbi:phage tail protein [Pseudomonas sp. B19125]|uniref:phage tail protein n=1 Tax=Pseudomonas sp. B19125 TaxID=3235109 RepID=UPI003783D815
MIDVNSQFFAILTAVGEAKQVKADAGQMTWKLTHMAVGDANDTNPIPDRLQKSLINERRRAPLNSLGPDPINPGILVAEQVIPADEGGFWIRELGLFDSDGDLVAVANCAPSYKSKLSQGSGRTQILRMNFIVKSSTNVLLQIDPSVVLATRKFVEDSVLNAVNALDYKASVLVATTAPIVLAGVQTIDGLVAPAGSRVLVKNQDKPAENGIYLVAAEGWVRAADSDNGTKVTPGMQVVVERGTVNADTLWLLSTDGAIVVGTTALSFKNITQGLAPINAPAFKGAATAESASRFDSSQLLATTEWSRRQGKTYSGSTAINNSGSILAAAVGQVTVLFGDAASTINLPVSSDLPIGSTVTVICYNTTSSAITRAGTDLIYGADPGQSVSVKSLKMIYGDILELTLLNNAAGAGAWYVSGGNMIASVVVPQFDSSQRQASTQFVQRSLGNLSGIRIYDTAAKLELSDFGRLILANSGAQITLTLPAIGGAQNGSTIHLRNVGTAPLTVVPPAGGSMSNVATVPLSGVVVAAGASFEATVFGNNYFFSGSASLKHESEFASSPNHQKLPGGDIEQWGLYISAPSGSDTVIPLPFAFSAVPTNIQLTFANFTNGESVGGSPVLQARNSTLGSITVRNLFGANASFFWRVRGKA